MQEAVRVSVVIPTTCRTSRVGTLRRAIASAQAQDGIELDLIVVVNGPDFDREMVDELCADPRMRVEYLPVPDLPAALRHGRTLALAPFFSFLDDDDEYLPGALRLRADVLLRSPEIDLVATNGFRGAGEQLYLHSTDGVESDPLGTLLRTNWLCSCGALFRGSTVPLDFFDGQTRYFEWTMLALRLALAGRRVRFLDTPTYRIHQAEGSLSRSEAYHRAEPDFLASLEAFDLPPRHRHTLRRKYHGALHALAERAVRNDDIASAWRFHVRSLRGWPGMRHAVYTRRLIVPSLRAAGRWLAARAGVRQESSGVVT